HPPHTPPFPTRRSSDLNTALESQHTRGRRAADRASARRRASATRRRHGRGALRARGRAHAALRHAALGALFELALHAVLSRDVRARKVVVYGQWGVYVR